MLKVSLLYLLSPGCSVTSLTCKVSNASQWNKPRAFKKYKLGQLSHHTTDVHAGSWPLEEGQVSQ
jgi:hypothetical protein